MGAGWGGRLGRAGAGGLAKTGVKGMRDVAANDMSYNRKVSPIYEALDARNPKQAVKLCDAALKKASIPLVRALKAVALERMGRTEDATALARQEAAAVAKSLPIDETVLSTLMIAFRALGLADEGSAAYEAAWQAEPDNSELAAHLFSSHLRTAQYAKAQALAMKMFKRPKGDEYIFWAVACLVLQVDEMGPPRQPHRGFADVAPPEAAAKHLQLGVAMLGRAAAQGKLSRLAHFQLYDEVLRRQHAHVDRLRLLDDHGQLEANVVERLRRRAALFEAERRWVEAQATHAELLREHTPDAWLSHAALLRCALVRTAADSAGTASSAALDEALDVIHHLQREQPKLRGPWLAELGLALHRCAPHAARALLHTTPDGTAAVDGAEAVDGDGTVPHSSSELAASVVANAAAEAIAAEAAALGRRCGAEAEAEAAVPPPVQALVTALIDYFGRYGDRPCGLLDTAPCLRALSCCPPAQRQLLAPLEASDAVDAPAGEGGARTLPQLRRYIALCQWRVGCGAVASLPEPERLSLASEWMAEYMRARPLSAGLDRRERGHADTLPLLAAQVRQPPSLSPSPPWPISQLLSAPHPPSLAPIPMPSPRRCPAPPRLALSLSPASRPRLRPHHALGLPACLRPCAGAPSSQHA